MARHTSANFTNFQFTWGDAVGDPFVHTDVELLAQAVEAHDHSSGKGLSAGRVISGLAIANPAFSGTASGSLTSLALTTPALTGPVTGDGSLPPRLLALVHADQGAFASVTINTASFTTLFTKAITVATPASAFVLMFGSVVFGSVSNTSGNSASLNVFLSGGSSVRTATTASVRIQNTPTNGNNFTFAWADLLLLPTGATTITVQAQWDTITGSPSMVSINNDGRWTGMTLIQLN